MSGKPLGASLDDFWVAGADLTDFHVNPAAAQAPAALLDELGPLPDEAGGARFTEMLVDAYANIAAGAERRAWLRPGAPLP